MSTFVRFVRTPGEQRYTLVTGLNEPYSPVRDPYGRMRRAVKSGRRLGDDQAVMTSAVANSYFRMRPHYEECAAGWLRYLAARGASTLVDVRTGRWQSGNLAVRVTPDLALEYPDGTVEAIKLYLPVDPVPESTAQTMLWLLQETMPQTCPGAIPVVVDVRRARSFTQLPTRAGYDAWLESEAASLAYLQARTAA